MDQKLEITNLVFGGGGTKGGSLPGAMKVVESHLPRANIIRCAGTSIGGVYGSLYAFGNTNDQIEVLLEQKKLSDFISGLSTQGQHKLMKGLNKANNGQNFFAAKTLKGAKGELKSNLKEDLGISDSAALVGWINKEALCATKIPNLTFGELAALNRKDPKRYKLLYLVATNLSTGRAAILSHENMPNVVVASATAASAAFPGAFQPVTLWTKEADGSINRNENSHKYTDGGLVNNCFVSLFDEARFIPGNEHLSSDYKIINPHTLAMRYVDAETKNYYDFGADIPVRAVDNIFELTTTVIMATFMQQETAMDTPENRARTIQIDNLGISTFEVQMTERKLNALIRSGEVSAKQFFSELSQEEGKVIIEALREEIKFFREDDKEANCAIL